MLAVPLLAGGRVVDRADATGALAGALLADLGAERVDAPLDDVDALIITGSPSALRAGGLDPHELVAAHPRLIVAAITPFGLSGPRAEWRTCDTVAQALGGMLLLNGHPDEPPLRALGAQAYNCAALQAALGIVLALLAREQTGHGQAVDVSIHESVVAALEPGEPRMRTRQGTLHWSGAFRVGQCADGPVLLSHLGDWTALLEWLKADGAAGDLVGARWADEAVRRQQAAHVFDVLDAWAARYTVDALVERAQALRLPFAPVWSVGEAARRLGSLGPWLTDESPASTATDVGRQTSDVERDGGAARAVDRPHPDPLPRGRGSRAPHAGPLAGVRVLDFTWVVAGPLASRVLADFGAEVIKIERVDSLDGPQRLGGAFGSLNRGKRSMAVDLNDPRGRAAVRELARTADVVLDNFSPRVMANWGLAGDALRALNPQAIAISMSGFGRARAEAVAFGPTLQAMAGFTWHMRHPGGRPAGLGFAYADMMSGYAAALAATAAVWRKLRSGHGATLALAQLDLVRRLLPPAAPDAAGNRSPEGDQAPHGVYRCRPRAGTERWCAAAVFDDREWTRFAAVVGGATREARFASAAGRAAHAAELDSLVELWTRAHTPEEATRLLQEAGIAAGTLADGTDLTECDPQLAARGFWETVSGETGPLVLDGVMPRLGATPGRARAAAPRLGEHSREVLRQVRGLEQSALDQLLRERVVREPVQDEAVAPPKATSPESRAPSPTRRATEDPMPRDFKTILCGTDFTDRSYLALDYALRFARLADGVLIVAHCVHVPSGDVYTHEAWPRTFEEAKARTREMLEQVHATRLHGYPKTELVVDIGPPAELLIQLATERRVDVLFTATHGRSELADLLLGSTTEKLIRHAPCPVFVVRPGVA
jgi:crotonobetainyl-CoA:carnitine CoA-transferase CaiB-like acyl-CoA transferase/nucleotide-binding universal stress UspA family protein